MPTPRIIGLTGYARSGKDTVAKLLEPAGFVRVAFADAVRAMALAINPILWFDIAGNPVRLVDVVVDAVGGWETAKDYEEVRRLLQVIGTDAVRNILGDRSWIAAADRKIADALEAGKSVVVTDVRFANEADHIRDLGGVVWRVSRPGFGPANAHASERDLELIHPDAWVHNASTIDVLAGLVSEAVNDDRWSGTRTAATSSVSAPVSPDDGFGTTDVMRTPMSGTPHERTEFCDDIGCAPAGRCIP